MYYRSRFQSCIGVTDAPDLDRFTRIPVSMQFKQQLTACFKFIKIPLFSKQKSAQIR